MCSSINLFIRINNDDNINKCFLEKLHIITNQHFPCLTSFIKRKGTSFKINRIFLLRKKQNKKIIKYLTLNGI